MYINIDTRETNRYSVVADSTEPEDRQVGLNPTSVTCFVVMDKPFNISASIPSSVKSG